LATFFSKIALHAKEQNKLVKILADNWRVLGMLRDQLPDVDIGWGQKGDLKPDETATA
jgi:homospermidine synthase